MTNEQKHAQLLALSTGWRLKSLKVTALKKKHSMIEFQSAFRCEFFFLKSNMLKAVERPYDDRSDVWSFGCIVLELGHGFDLKF